MRLVFEISAALGEYWGLTSLFEWSERVQEWTRLVFEIPAALGEYWGLTSLFEWSERVRVRRGNWPPLALKWLTIAVDVLASSWSCLC